MSKNTYQTEIKKINAALEHDISDKPALLDELQSQLDELFVKYEDDNSLGTSRHALYQAQSLIWFRRGDMKLAANWMEQAVRANGGMYDFAEEFFANTDLYDNTNRLNRLSHLLTTLISQALFYIPLFMLAIIILPLFLLAKIFPPALPIAIGIIISLIVLAPILHYGLRVNQLRLHDMGLSGWWQLLLFIPLVNFLFVLFLFIFPGDEGSNQYGKPPMKVLIYDPRNDWRAIARQVRSLF